MAAAAGDMSLPTGSRLGPYEILSLIGVGGMGEVYAARDTRLDRPVAIKLLHAEFAERPDRRARFETEARAISSLNHPHICTLFDVGDQDGRAFLVMEYLEGETLDDRLTRGPMPPNDVLRCALEIARALDHAHRQQITHRDVKPSNVMLTASGAKLLDFGLAKGPLVTASGVPSSTLSFEQRQLTAEGTMIGTFQYMAPEQLEGHPADARTDIFAFGTLLYEMATGRKAFDGKSQASLIASILTEQPPPISSVRGGIESDSPLFALDHLVERCLAKLPDERWQSARDLTLELEWIIKGRPEFSRRVWSLPRLRRRETLAWIVAIVAIVAATLLALLPSRRAREAATRFVVPAPSGTTIGIAESRTRIAISPDGRRLAMVAAREGTTQIWVRSLDSVTSEPVPGTEGAVSPFWSPDSHFLGFFSSADGEMKRVDVTGGPARTICAAQVEGAPVWGPEGTILFTQAREGIFRVAAVGGAPTRVTQVDRAKGELSHLWPEFLPDGRHFLYLAMLVNADGVQATPHLYAASLDSSEVTLVAQMHSRAVFAAPGRLLFVQNGALLAQSFDTTKLRLTGEPVQISDEIGYFRTLGAGAFTASGTDVLAYLGSRTPFSLIWYDRSGASSESAWQAQNVGSVRISPDGQRAAVDIADSRLGTADIWIYDTRRGAPVRVTTDLTNQSQPVWSPDGRRILFRSERPDGGTPSLYARDIGTGTEEPVLVEPGSTTPLSPEDWSPDGQWISYFRGSRQTGSDLWLMPLSGDRQPVAFAKQRFDEFGARFSPDSRWVAFASTESGSPEVYVAPLTQPGNKTRVSVGGGSTPRWRADGRELFYAAADNRSVMAVAVNVASSFVAGTPKRLFFIGQTPAARDRGRSVVYDVTPDGARFLVSIPSGEPSSSRVTVVLNWTAGLQR
jgi:serine/threonine protein kinase/Tol biopolymer transport system component